MSQQIKLELRPVGAINGCFQVPSYQRGYRWRASEVTRLLDDIHEAGDQDYCLQPIVVKKSNGKYELIDGQQRLTTLYLLYRYLDHDPNHKPPFSLTYETRSKSSDFLGSLDASRRDENIDFHYIMNAYETIGDWFKTRKDLKDVIRQRLDKDRTVKIIWYEVDGSVDGNALFTRLNIGKIPLTNAELVKALFLNGAAQDPSFPPGCQREIALQWDSMERELQRDSFWYFLTNTDDAAHQSRIDLILELAVWNAIPADSTDMYSTFFAFEQQSQGVTNLFQLWKDVRYAFLTLRGWYEDHDLYHKIGYLIASKQSDIKTLFMAWKGQDPGRDGNTNTPLTRPAFLSYLKNAIRKSISSKEPISDLSYDSDYDLIFRILLLFNVETVCTLADQSQRFPFDRFKVGSDGKPVTWSLEHIHAQHSEQLRKQEQWKTWLKLHADSIRALQLTDPSVSSLLSNMESARNKANLTWQEFSDLADEAVKLLNSQDSSEDVHSIDNLALLNMDENVVLSNSTFDVKREQIIQMVRKGKNIPFCTLMVFLKFYTPSEHAQFHFWGQEDRKGYLEAMEKVLEPYLPVS